MKVASRTALTSSAPWRPRAANRSVRRVNPLRSAQRSDPSTVRRVAAGRIDAARQPRHVCGSPQAVVSGNGCHRWVRGWGPRAVDLAVAVIGSPEADALADLTEVAQRFGGRPCSRRDTGLVGAAVLDVDIDEDRRRTRPHRSPWTVPARHRRPSTRRSTDRRPVRWWRCRRQHPPRHRRGSGAHPVPAGQRLSSGIPSTVRVIVGDAAARCRACRGRCGAVVRRVERGLAIGTRRCGAVSARGPFGTVATRERPRRRVGGVVGLGPEHDALFAGREHIGLRAR